MIRIIVETDTEEQAAREAVASGLLSGLGQPFQVVRARPGDWSGRAIGGGGAWGVTLARPDGQGFKTPSGDDGNLQPADG